MKERKKETDGRREGQMSCMEVWPAADYRGEQQRASLSQAERITGLVEGAVDSRSNKAPERMIIGCDVSGQGGWLIWQRNKLRLETVAILAQIGPAILIRPRPTAGCSTSLPILAFRASLSALFILYLSMIDRLIQELIYLPFSLS
jgi:hypothetical protein